MATPGDGAVEKGGEGMNPRDRLIESEARFDWREDEIVAACLITLASGDTVETARQTVENLRWQAKPKTGEEAKRFLAPAAGGLPVSRCAESPAGRRQASPEAAGH